MSELRFNELRGEQVVYAIHRQDRTFLPGARPLPARPHATGRAGDGDPAGEHSRSPSSTTASRRSSAPHGAAEVVVYTDDHDGSFGALAPERAEALMWVWRHRYSELGARADIDYVFIFENRGVEVGVTLHHPHGQIYGYPFIPPVPALELAADARLGGCAPCALLAARARRRQPRAARERRPSSPTSRTPRAGRYEAHVAMREHRASLLRRARPIELRELAEALQRIVRGYDALFERPSRT